MNIPNSITITEEQDLSQIPLADVTVLDFSEVRWITSVRMGEFIALFNRAKDKVIRIENMSEEVRALFTQLGIIEVYKHTVPLPQ